MVDPVSKKRVDGPLADKVVGDLPAGAWIACKDRGYRH
jgi:hypothetical protein